MVTKLEKTSDAWAISVTKWGHIWERERSQIWVKKLLTLFMDDPKSRRSLVLSLASLAVFFLIAVMTVLSLVRLHVIHEERPRKH